MGWLSKPDAPDPAATAAAQQKLNLATSSANAEQSHVNQITPFGNQSWATTGTNADGTPQYTQTNTLAPQMQTMLDSQMSQDNALTRTGNSLIGQVDHNISNPISTDGMHQVQGGMNSGQMANWAGGYQNSAGPAAQASAAQASASQVHATLATGGPIQGQIAGAGDLQGQFNRAQGAALDQQMGYLKPQQQNTANHLTDSLRQQGITQESNPAAYQHAMDQQNRDNTFQNQQAFDSSYNSGLASSNQLFNQNLGAGNFANAAQQQGFGQSAFNAQQRNAASLANAAAANQASQFNAGASTQASMANAEASNQQGQFNVGANNNAQNNIMAGQATNSSINNAANAQDMTNMFALRNAPMNALSSIRSATPVSSPTFNQYQQGSAQAPNYMGAVQNNYTSQLGSYNNMMSGLFSLGGSAIKAA